MLDGFFKSKNEKHKFLSSQLKAQNENQGLSMMIPEESLSSYSHSAEIDKIKYTILSRSLLNYTISWICSLPLFLGENQSIDQERGRPGNWKRNLWEDSDNSESTEFLNFIDSYLSHQPNQLLLSFSWVYFLLA